MHTVLLKQAAQEVSSPALSSPSPESSPRNSRHSHTARSEATTDSHQSKINSRPAALPRSPAGVCVCVCMHLLVCAFMHARDFEHTHTYAWQQGIELLNCLQTAHGSTTQKYSYVDASSVTDVDLFSCACSVQIKARYHWWNHLPLPDVIGAKDRPRMWFVRFSCRRKSSQCMKTCLLGVSQRAS